MVVSDLVVDGLGELPAVLPWVAGTCLGAALTEPQYLAGLDRAGLADGRIMDRVTYDARRIVELLRSECTAGDGASACDRAAPLQEIVQRTCAGRVHSVRIGARKAS